MSITVAGSTTTTVTRTIGKSGPFGNFSVPVTRTSNLVLSNGTGDNQADLNHSARVTLAAAPLTLDLAALDDIFGGPVDLAKARAIYFKNLSSGAGAHSFTVAPGATNGWVGWMGAGSSLTVPAGGVLEATAPLGAGFAVSGTSKTITLDPGANTIDVEVVIDGCSA
jgi:hypothetical protein